MSEVDREPDDRNDNESLLATGSGATRTTVRFGNCPVCKMVAVGDECTTCMKNERDWLRAECDALATQALVVLQLDFGYSPGLPCRYGHHPMRHESLWRKSVEVLSGVIPDVEETRAVEAVEKPQSPEELAAVLRVFLSFREHVGSGKFSLSRGEFFWHIEWITCRTQRYNRWCYQWQFTDESASYGADELGKHWAGVAKEEFRVALQKKGEMRQ